MALTQCPILKVRSGLFFQQMFVHGVGDWSLRLALLQQHVQLSSMRGLVTCVDSDKLSYEFLALEAGHPSLMAVQ